jgi:hypothetical protein
LGGGAYMFKGLFDFFYFKIRREEIQKAKYRLRRLKINTLLDLLIRNCREKNIIYNVLEQTKTEMLVELTGSKEKILLKYDMAYMIFDEEYDDFIDKMKKIKLIKVYT